MRNLFLSLCALVAVAAILSVGKNAWEELLVEGAIDEVLRQDNSHTFSNRSVLEAALAEATMGVVGKKAFLGTRPNGRLNERGDVFIYHFRPVVPINWFKSISDVPAIPGVVVRGSDVHVDALVANVWWARQYFWFWEEDASVTSAVIVDPELVQTRYDVNNEPWVAADHSKYVDRPWTVIDRLD